MIKMVPYRPAGPASVNRYLLPNERHVITVRRHPSVLLIPAAEAVGGLAVALIVNSALINDFAATVAVWTGAAFLAYQMFSSTASWYVHFLVVTSHRVLNVYGLTRQTVETTPLANVRNIVLDRSFAGRMLGYGTFYLPSGNRKQVLMDYVPYPEQLYLKVCGMLFDSDESEGVSEEDSAD